MFKNLAQNNLPCFRDYLLLNILNVWLFFLHIIYYKINSLTVVKNYDCYNHTKIILIIVMSILPKTNK